MSNVSKTVIFVLFICLASFALGEVALRTAQYFLSGVSPFTMLPGYSERRYLLSPFLAFGPRIDWQIPNKPSAETAYFNGQGFRTKESVGPKPEGEFRIVAIGGSTTEDVWTEDGLHWPLWLERRLKGSSLDARVLNTGMSAYTSAHSLVRLEFDVLDHHPNLVVVMHNINDLVVNYYAAVLGQPVDGHYRSPYTTKQFTGETDDHDVVLSRLCHSLRARLRPAPADKPVPNDYRIDQGLTYFRRNLRNIHALASANGTAVILLTMPLCDAETVYRKVELNGRKQFSAPLPESFDRFKKDFAAYNQAIAAVGADVGATVVDMHRLLGGDPRWFSDFVHFSAAGSKRFGEVLAAELEPRIRQSAAGASGATAPAPR